MLMLWVGTQGHRSFRDNHGTILLAPSLHQQRAGRLPHRPIRIAQAASATSSAHRNAATSSPASRVAITARTASQYAVIHSPTARSSVISTVAPAPWTHFVQTQP